MGDVGKKDDGDRRVTLSRLSGSDMDQGDDIGIPEKSKK